MRVKLNKTPEEVLEAIHASVSLARNLVPDVEWSAEDATRSDPEFLVRAIEVAIKAGARTINLPDTVGYATPETYGRMFRDMRERVPDSDLERPFAGQLQIHARLFPYQQHASRHWPAGRAVGADPRSEEHTSELQSLMRIS